MYVGGSTEAEDRYLTSAAFYGLYLRRVCGYDADEAAALVVDRYPHARPTLEKLVRGNSTPGPSPDLPPSLEWPEASAE